MTPSLATIDRPDVDESDVGPYDDLDLETVELSDDELTVIALAADPDAAVDPDAVPLLVDESFPELLPSWYMPVPSARVRKRWHKVAGLTVIMAFVIINILGCCITYGHLVAA